MTTIAVVALLAVAVGLALGLLGGGGSILLVPLLVGVAGLGAQEAVTTSLVVVGATAAVAVFGHARAGRVRWRTGLVFGGAGILGAYPGGLLGARLPSTVLLLAFAAMMLVTGWAMLRRRAPPAVPVPHEHRASDAPGPDRALPVRRVLLHGAAVGLVTGMVGAGGGFLVVPALVLLGGLPMVQAVGTSLLVIALKSFGGAAGYLGTVDVDWTLVSATTLAAVAGTVAGTALTGRVPSDALRTAFAVVVLAAGTALLLQTLPDPARWPAAGVLAAAAALLVLRSRGADRRARHRTGAPVDDGAPRQEQVDRAAGRR